MLTADAFGVLPPISKLIARSSDVPLPLRIYGEGCRYRARGHRAASNVLDLLRRAVHGASSGGLRATARTKIDEHDVECWLVNTGWTGGPYGIGHRMSIRAHARDGQLGNRGTHPGAVRARAVLRSDDPHVAFRTFRPTCSTRANAWSDRAAYDEQARKLARLFFDNFKRFEGHVSPAINAVAIRPLARS